MDAPLSSPAQLQEYGYRKSSIIDHTLDDARLETRCPLDNGRHHGQPKYPAGRLDLLPTELITYVLLALDLPSLTAFRRVNRRAMSLVDSLHQYRMIFEHCPDILRAMVSIDAKYFDCASLFNTLSSTKCATCDRFGGHLYLITCKRVCYFCFILDPLYLPVSATLATKHTGLSRKELKRLPHILGLPGRFTDHNKLVRGRIMLLDRQSLRNRISRGSTQAFDDVSWQVDLTTREPRRFMSIISAPFFTSSGRSADWGFYCNKCIDNKEPETHYRNKYTESGFMDHMARFGINHGGKQ
ncbi:F-box domain containing protein, partial [Metarhizium majus ARSEF 297]